MKTLRYGPQPAQEADLLVPEGAGPWPAVVLFHGGSFEAAYGRSMLAAAAEDLVRRGFLVLNATYRRLGNGGGWPETFQDARAALGLLRARDDVRDAVVLGFSAGFPVAAYAVARAEAADRVRGLVDLAGITALEGPARAGGASGSVWRLLGDPEARPEVYAEVEPAVGLAVPALVVHGEQDELVPVDLGRAWAAAVCEAGGTCALEVVPGAGHFDVHVPGGAGWEAVVGWLG